LLARFFVEDIVPSQTSSFPEAAEAEAADPKEFPPINFSTVV
jgi:hypothetical protein